MTSQAVDPLDLVVLTGSVREPRVGAAVVEWVHRELAAEPLLRPDVIDIAGLELPPAAAMAPGGGSERTAIAHRIEAADAYVFITPEYNHSFPGALKQVVDWHYREWMFKPAMLVSYGVQGGLLAAEQLRQVLAELHVVAVRRVVAVAEPWAALTATGLEPTQAMQAGLDVATQELLWWARALRTARRDHPFAS